MFHLRSQTRALTTHELKLAIHQLSPLAQGGELLLTYLNRTYASFEARFQGVQLVLQETQLLPLPLLLGRDEALGAPGLDLEGAHARAQLAGHIFKARQVLMDARQPQLGLVLALAVATDPRRLLEDPSPVDGIGGKYGVDPSLLEDRVAATAQPRIEEQFTHVLEAHAAAVDQILTIAALEHAPGDLHLLAAADEGPTAVVQHDGRLGHAERRPARAALEDDVGHLLAAHGSRALLAEHPSQGVDDVALTAAVRSDDTRQGVASELEDRTVGKGLETKQLETMESHVRVDRAWVRRRQPASEAPVSPPRGKSEGLFTARRSAGASRCASRNSSKRSHPLSSGVLP